MAIGDLLKGIFLNRDEKKQSDEYGPTGLPRNIEEDLLRGSQSSENSRNQRRGNNEPSGQFYFDFYPSEMPNSSRNHHHFENHGHEDVFSFEQQMMNELDSMMKNMFGGLDGGLFQGFHQGTDPPNESFVIIDSPETDGQRKQGGSLREKMLGKDESKQKMQHFPPFGNEDSQIFSFGFHPPSFFKDFFNDSMMRSSPDFNNRNHGQFEDRDLDKDIASGKQSLDDILGKGDFTQAPKEPRLEMVPPSGFSSTFRFSSTTRRMNPDGSVETVTTKRDSHGNEETITTRSIDGQTHSITERKNKDGIEEKREDIVNMEEGDLKGFEEKWKGTQKSDDASTRNRVLSPYRQDAMNETIDNWKDYLSTWWNSKL